MDIEAEIRRLQAEIAALRALAQASGDQLATRKIGKLIASRSRALLCQYASINGWARAFAAVSSMRVVDQLRFRDARSIKQVSLTPP